MMGSCATDLTTSVQQCLCDKEFSLALRQIKNVVENIITHPQLDGIILNAEELDVLCLAVGKEISHRYFSNVVVSKEVTKTILYVATELYLSGGHTAVIEDFIKAQPDNDHIILLTDLFLSSGDQKALQKRFASLPVKIIWCPKRVMNVVKKVIWLKNEWLRINPCKVFLFNHHQDVVAIAAAQPDMPGKLFFFHHADYQLTLGMHLPHAVHIDFYSVLYKRCREEFGIKNNVYYPLVVEDSGYKLPDSFMQEGKLRTCSSGGAGKYDRPYGYSYAEVLPNILKVTNGIHIHVGALPKKYLQKIRRLLEINQINQNRFIYVPWVKSVWKFLIENNVDLYVASFPVGGGRAAVEVMGAGIPIVFHNNHNASFLGGAIQYPGALFWREETELLKFLMGLNKEILMKHSVAAREQYEKYHQPALLRKALISAETLSMDTSEFAVNACASTRLVLDDFLKKYVRLTKSSEIKDNLFLILRWSAHRGLRFLRGLYRGD